MSPLQPEPLPHCLPACAVVRRREERGAPAVIDAPLRWHWRKAVWWAAAQVVYLAATIVVAVDADDRRQLHAGKDAQVAAGGSCHDASYNCSSWGGWVGGWVGGGGLTQTGGGRRVRRGVAAPAPQQACSPQVQHAATAAPAPWQPRCCR